MTLIKQMNTEKKKKNNCENQFNLCYLCSNSHLVFH